MYTHSKASILFAVSDDLVMFFLGPAESIMYTLENNDSHVLYIITCACVLW